MERIRRRSVRVGAIYGLALFAAGSAPPDCSQESADLEPQDSTTCWNLYQPCLDEGYVDTDTVDCNSYLSTQTCAALPNPDCGHPYFHCQWESFETEAECLAALAACNRVPVGAPCKDYFRACLMDDLGWGGCEILFGGDCLSLTEETDCEELFFACFQWRFPAATCGPYLDGRACPALVYERAPDVYFACRKSGFDEASCDAVLASVNRAGEVAPCATLAAQCRGDGIAPGICDALFDDCNFTPPGEPGSDW